MFVSNRSRKQNVTQILYNRISHFIVAVKSNQNGLSLHFSTQENAPISKYFPAEK